MTKSAARGQLESISGSHRVKRAHDASCPAQTGRVRRWKQRWEFSAKRLPQVRMSTFRVLPPIATTPQVQVQGKHRSALPGFWWEPAGGHI